MEPNLSCGECEVLFRLFGGSIIIVVVILIHQEFGLGVIGESVQSVISNALGVLPMG